MMVACSLHLCRIILLRDVTRVLMQNERELPKSHHQWNIALLLLLVFEMIINCPHCSRKIGMTLWSNSILLAVILGIFRGLTGTLGMLVIIRRFWDCPLYCSFRNNYFLPIGTKLSAPVSLCLSGPAALSVDRLLGMTHNQSDTGQHFRVVTMEVWKKHINMAFII